MRMYNKNANKGRSKGDEDWNELSTRTYVVLCDGCCPGETAL
jgi:hypothetical protein